MENVLIDTGDTDTGPHCMGTFASRTTHRAGNAIIMAAEEAKKTMLEIAADELEARPDDLEADGKGFVCVKGSPDRKIHLVNLALAGHFKYGKTVAGPRHLLQAEPGRRSGNRQDGPRLHRSARLRGRRSGGGH